MVTVLNLWVIFGFFHLIVLDHSWLNTAQRGLLCISGVCCGFLSSFWKRMFLIFSLECFYFDLMTVSFSFVDFLNYDWSVNKSFFSSAFGWSIKYYFTLSVLNMINYNGVKSFLAGKSFWLSDSKLALPIKRSSVKLGSMFLV
jgi:hypothetical protein